MILKILISTHSSLEQPDSTYSSSPQQRTLAARRSFITAGSPKDFDAQGSAVHEETMAKIKNLVNKRLSDKVSNSSSSLSASNTIASSSSNNLSSQPSPSWKPRQSLVNLQKSYDDVDRLHAIYSKSKLFENKQQQQDQQSRRSSTSSNSSASTSVSRSSSNHKLIAPRPLGLSQDSTIQGSTVDLQSSMATASLISPHPLTSTSSTSSSSSSSSVPEYRSVMGNLNEKRNLQQKQQPTHYYQLHIHSSQLKTSQTIHQQNHHNFAPIYNLVCPPLPHPPAPPPPPPRMLSGPASVSNFLPVNTNTTTTNYAYNTTLGRSHHPTPPPPHRQYFQTPQGPSSSISSSSFPQTTPPPPRAIQSRQSSTSSIMMRSVPAAAEESISSTSNNPTSPYIRGGERIVFEPSFSSSSSATSLPTTQSPQYMKVTHFNIAPAPNTIHVSSTTPVKRKRGLQDEYDDDIDGEQFIHSKPSGGGGGGVDVGKQRRWFNF